MKKTSQDIENAAEKLTADLFGDVGPSVGEADNKFDFKDKYQLPVRHNASGTTIDENNKASVLSTYVATPIYRSVDKTVRPHYGVDLQAPAGSPIYPIGPGIVKAVQLSDIGRGGKTVHLSHEDGKVTSYYAHLDKVHVVVGQQVDFNTVIGDVGNTGNAKRTDSHLHYEVKVDGKRVNPQSVTGQEVGSLSKKAQFIQDLINKLDSDSSLNPSKARLKKLKGILKDDQYTIQTGEARTEDS